MSDQTNKEKLNDLIYEECKHLLDEDEMIGDWTIVIGTRTITGGGNTITSGGPNRQMPKWVIRGLLHSALINLDSDR